MKKNHINFMAELHETKLTIKKKKKKKDHKISLSE